VSHGRVLVSSARMAGVSIPSAPTLTSASVQVAKALTAVLALPSPCTVDLMARRARAFGGALADDPAGCAQTLAETQRLARQLVALGDPEAIKAKPARAAAWERHRQLEMLAYGLRLAREELATDLAALATEVPDGPVRGVLVDVLSGGQILLPPTARAAVAALWSTSSSKVVLRCASQAWLAVDHAAAVASWRALLAEPPAAEDAAGCARVWHVLDRLGDDAGLAAAFAGLVAPLTRHPDRAVRIRASSFVTASGERSVAFLGWVAGEAYDPQLVAQIAEGMRFDPQHRAVLAEPLRALLGRAREAGDDAAVAALARRLKALGVDQGAEAKRPPDHGRRLARNRVG
jgi:hypothetical protein